jgi:hypothetical protein
LAQLPLLSKVPLRSGSGAITDPYRWNRSGTFAEYAIGHLTPLRGPRMIVDSDQSTILSLQEIRPTIDHLRGSVIHRHCLKPSLGRIKHT